VSCNGSGLIGLRREATESMAVRFEMVILSLELQARNARFTNERAGFLISKE
jgi:hypothetical protein